jgi:aspartyl-tRNA synthetase
MAPSEELGDIRRTHLSSDMDPALDGEDVVVMGWVAAVRSHGNITFATVRDRTGPIQIVAKKGICDDAIRAALARTKPHSSVAVRGRASASARAPGGVEIIPNTMSVLSAASRTPPFEPATVSVPNIDTRLEVRCIDLRREPLRHIFGARTAVLRAIREYFYGNDFTEISTPKMIASATEGGSALFPIFYYDKEAFLAQSPQLYKEQLTMSFERVFEISPIFRAEPSRTNRHLAEAISIDMEEAFVDYNDVMDRTVEVVRRAAGAVQEYAERNPGAGYDIPDTAEVPRYTYEELAGRIRDETDLRMTWGDDLHPSWLRRLGLDGLYFITDWPMGPKPFYVKTRQDDPRVSESFDLMWGDLELSSGSTRMNDRDGLEQNMRNKGMKTASFAHHLGAFEYGVPPHAGCGIGLERLMMALTGTENIRDATFYPRDVDRLTP